MFSNADHNDTTLWEVEAELDIPAEHNEDERDRYGRIVSRVFTAQRADTRVAQCLLVCV